MPSLENREKAFEDMYARDADLRFKVLARRDKLAGLWAAEKLGLSGDAAADYAKSIVLADLAKPGDEDVVAKLVADLGDLSNDAEVRAQLAVAFIESERQFREAL